MNNTWLLIKTMLKMQYSNAGKKGSNLWLYVVAFIFLLPVSIIYISFINGFIHSLYSGLQPFGQESALLGILFLGIHLLLFIMSLVTVLSAFYFADDIQSYIPFPFHPYQLLIGKAASPFLYLYVTSAIIFLPVFFSYGSAGGESLFYYLYGIILFMLLPIIPFAIAAIILMFMMRFVNVAKNKDRSKVIAGISSFLLIILFNIFIRLKTNSNEMVEELTVIFQKQDGLLEMVTVFYPPAYLSASALGDSQSWLGLIYFIAMLALTAGALLLFAWLGQLLYLKGVLGLNNSGKHKLSKQKMQRKMKRRPVRLSYITKELKIIFRTPTFLMQCVMQGLFGPILVVVILLFDFGTGLSLEFLDTLSDKQILLLLFIASFIIISTNVTAVSSVSREGKTWYTNLFFPLEPNQVLFSKIAASWIINLFVITLFFILSLLVTVPVVVVLIWLVTILTASWLTSSFGTYLDLLKPKLNWTDEQELFKGRFIGFIGFLIQAGILGIFTWFLWRSDAVENLYATSLILLGLLLVCIFIVYKLIDKKINSNVFQDI
ncbi:putative ABC transporter permease subunit [Oceanobacillus damuensis]|uniref:putative ABC transporter permease subunit n=1 Tax=Oceanobacillus damuensis TaxID=937928 RepID=UPI000830C462|nr:hypothetical protein [Oceanobacillus damuensis]